MKKVIITIFALLLFYSEAKSDYPSFDEYIKQKCIEHKGADEKYFNENMGKRCTLIGQAQFRFESRECKIVIGNNCFGFRAPTIKKEWKIKYNVTGIKKGFLTFNSKYDSINFYIDRFYKFDRYKTISQIIAGGYYCSPITGWCGDIDGFTHTKEHQPFYIDFVKKYYRNNKN